MEDTNVKIIMEYVDWYRELPKDYTNIEHLMYVRKQLTTTMFYLGVELSKSREYWKQCDVIYESKRRKICTAYLEENMPMTKSVEYAKAECVPEYKEEKYADANYNALKLVYESSLEVINTLMQHISIVRKEKEQSSQFT